MGKLQKFEKVNLKKKTQTFVTYALKSLVNLLT